LERPDYGTGLYRIVIRLFVCSAGWIFIELPVFHLAMNVKARGKFLEIAEKSSGCSIAAKWLHSGISFQ
jgi:hypothetical protein